MLNKRLKYCNNNIHEVHVNKFGIAWCINCGELFSKEEKDMIKTKKYCNCGNYQPISTKGVKDYRCKNCGGYKKPIKLK